MDIGHSKAREREVPEAEVPATVYNYNYRRLSCERSQRYITSLDEALVNKKHRVMRKGLVRSSLQ